jgi:hypothetical protein
MQRPKTKIEREMKILWTNLANILNPWKPIHGINLEIFLLWNHFLPNANAIYEIKTEPRD